MTCRAAQKAAFDVVTRWRSITARAAFERIRWWTPETVEEALDLMAFEGRLVKLRFSNCPATYRRADWRSKRGEDRA